MPADTDDTDNPARTCDQCGCKMVFIATLPKVAGLPALNTFRCTQCDYVATEPAK